MNTEVIKNRVTMPDVLSRYGIYDGNKRRIPCPIHGGKNPNFAFNDNSFICFKCDAAGDVISFVQQYFNLSFPEAIKRLEDDFFLNRPLTLREKYNIIERQKQKKDPLKEEWENLYAYARQLTEYKQRYKPNLDDDTLHPLFVEALQELEHIDEEIYLIEGRMRCNAIKR